MKVKIFILKNVLFLLTVFFLILFIQTCKKDSPTELNTDNSDTYYSKSSDTTSTYENYYFDIDKDGKTDYIFHHSYMITQTIPPASIESIYIKCLDSNQVNYSSAKRETRPILDSIMIDDSIGWNIHSGVLGESSTTYTNNANWLGYFVGIEPHNIGLRLNRQGSYYYGWVKALIMDDGKLKILNYAYKLTANRSIMAGIHP